MVAWMCQGARLVPKFLVMRSSSALLGNGGQEDGPKQAHAVMFAVRLLKECKHTPHRSTKYVSLGVETPRCAVMRHNYGLMSLSAEQPFPVVTANELLRRAYGGQMFDLSNVGVEQLFIVVIKILMHSRGRLFLVFPWGKYVL